QASIDLPDSDAAKQQLSLLFHYNQTVLFPQVMASSLPFILLCLQLVSIVFSSSDLSGHVYRRSPAKTPKPAPGTAAPNGNPPNPKTTGKPAPFGFGSKVTSGGNATPQTPKDAAQLEAWLTDKVPRVILISKTYDFTSLTNTTASGWYLNFNLMPTSFDPCPEMVQPTLESLLERPARSISQTGRDIFEWARKQYYQHFSPSDSRLSPPARLMAKLSATQRAAATQVETAFALHL
ncbi:hypothetical protein PSHT_00959, partial [Puccinia striiformis]